MMDRALVSSREKAQSMIIAGRVLVNEQKITKPGACIPDASELRILGDDPRYVSRGGIKLERALQHWQIDVNGASCMDVGTSTGGFTDCMLQHGASQVLCVDTGYGQIASKLRSDPRVILRENKNARHLTVEDVGPAVDFVAMDVSFISLTLVLPAVISAGFQSGSGELVVLIKPQFEVGREHVGKGGIVRDEAAQLGAVDRVRSAVTALRGEDMQVIDSPILGAKGNREFLLHAVWPRIC